MNLMILLSSNNEQKHFAAKVARYERLRSQQREAERQVEMLFQSLLAEAFGG